MRIDPLTLHFTRQKIFVVFMLLVSVLHPSAILKGNANQAVWAANHRAYAKQVPAG